MNWRNKRYGRMSGGEIEKCLEMFREVWSGKSEWSSIMRDEVKWWESVEKLTSVPNWIPFYQLTLTELLARIIVLTGITDKFVAASRSEDPATAVLSLVDEIPDEPIDNVDSLPLAFAMIGNLDAIARYSRSINDMVIACRGGDVEALFHALSIDSYVSTMPFFQAAMRLGQFTSDPSWAESIFRAIRGPHQKRGEYPELRWIEYLLRDQGAFASCSREDIYDLCVEYLGVYDPAGTKKDPKAALFSRFRSWQKEAGIQNPRFGFSAKA